MIKNFLCGAYGCRPLLGEVRAVTRLEKRLVGLAVSVGIRLLQRGYGRGREKPDRSRTAEGLELKCGGSQTTRRAVAFCGSEGTLFRGQPAPHRHGKEAYEKVAIAMKKRESSGVRLHPVRFP